VEHWGHEDARLRGFTLVELIVVIVLIGIIAMVASPHLRHMRSRSALQNGRAAVTAMLARARAASTRWGTTSVLRIDIPNDRIRVDVDTSAAGEADDTLVVSTLDLGELGVDIDADHDAICFDSRGVGTIAAACPVTGSVVVLSYGADRDTLRINAAGRIWR